jgi:alternate signal-mediated exported protein
MKTVVKAATATTAAVFLLLGGAGTLAYWQSSESMGEGSVSSGRLALTDPTPGRWTLDGTPVADPTAVRIVPGDELAWTGSFVIDASGDHLRGDLAVTGGAATGSLAPYVDATAVTWTLDGQPASGTITSADDGRKLDVSIMVDFPYGTAVDNGSQSKVLDLSSVAVTLTQADATPQG